MGGLLRRPPMVSIVRCPKLPFFSLGNWAIFLVVAKLKEWVFALSLFLIAACEKSSTVNHPVGQFMNRPVGQICV